MASVPIEGVILGEKHRSFNKLVENAVKSATDNVNIICYGDLDVDNLLRIEIACRTRNVDFILETLKCRDMLYVSRAIKLSTWLITEDQYSHIINSDYIHTHLLSHMNLKAYNKFMLKIRLNLRDEQRVDAFFYYFYERDFNRALKWLPQCSSHLAEEIVQKHSSEIPLSVMEKFSNKSNCVYIYCKKNESDFNKLSKALNILKQNNTEKYLNIVFDLIDAYYHVDGFTSQTTNRIIKRCPNRTLNDFIKFLNVIHIPTLVKKFNDEEIKDVLIKNSRSKKYESLYKYDKLKFFIARLPQQDKLDLIKNVFIDKVEPVFTSETDLCNSTLIRCLTNMNNAYLWCELLPFDDAFKELKVFIGNESNPVKRSYMLCTLLSSAHKNYNNIQLVLQYYVDSHIQEGIRFKTQFLQHLLNAVNILKLNPASWNLLNNIFYSVGVYTKMDNVFPKYRPNPFIVIGRRRKNYATRVLQSDNIFVECIILYNVIHDIDIPEILISKFKFTTFKNIQNKLCENQKTKLFDFLLLLAENNLEHLDMKDENNFDKYLANIQHALQLLNDWNNKIEKYPSIFTKIQMFGNIYLDSSKKDKVQELFEMAKSMRFLIEPEKRGCTVSIEYCLNALKHNPQLLVDIKKHNIITLNSKKRSVCRFLCYLRLYWHDSFAIEFKDEYHKYPSQSSDKPNWNIPWELLSEKEVFDLIQEYFPCEEIEWQKDLTFRQEIAKRLHLCRPRLPLNTVFQYIDSNNLKYFLPSLHSLMYDMDPYQIHDIFSKLERLSSSHKRLSLRNHCFKITLKRLNCEEFKNVLKDLWKTTKTHSSQVLIFKLTLSLLCEAKDNENILVYWSLLNGFIDDVTEHGIEAPSIFKALCNLKSVPRSIMEDYYNKVHKLLQSLSCQTYLQEFLKRSECDLEAKVKELQIILQKKRYGCPYWLADFLLNVSTKEIQLRIYERLLVPILEDQRVILSERQPFIIILRSLYSNIDHNVLYREAVVPIAMFTDIQERLEKRLPFYENYVLITSGRLLLGYLNILEKYISNLFDKHEVNQRTQQEFAEFCADYLDKEIREHYQSIYMPFSDSLTFLFNSMDKQKEMGFIDAMLNRNSRSECVLTVFNDLPRKTFRTPDEIMYSGFLNNIKTHPSEEVRMLYSNYFIKTDSL